VNGSTGMIIDRTTNSIVLTREFSGPREEVFEAWTKPEHVACWWDPMGHPLVECEIDLRPGGAFKFVNRGGAHAFSGVYREIRPPERLVFEGNGAIGTVSFDDDRGATRLTVTIACGSEASLDQFLKMGVDAGTAKTLDNLVAYLGKGQEAMRDTAAARQRASRAAGPT
jgi:uncharacterized protein YndB with AHSA1/START domain